jgi:hypothetical protein
MTGIGTYTNAMKMLTEIENGTCSGACKSSCIRNLRYALKTKTNPLKLTEKERKTMTAKIKSVAGRQSRSVTASAKKKKRDSELKTIHKHSKTLKKYKTRNSPPYPANENCGRRMKGNDGKLYISTANVKDICSWKKV